MLQNSWMKRAGATAITKDALRGVIFLLAVCVLVSCGPKGNDQKSTSEKKASRPVGSNARPLTSLEMSILDIHIETKVLKAINREMQGDNLKDINVLSKSFTPIQTSIGILLIECEEVVPYLNGHKLKLKIGNPLVAKISGVTLKCVYGPKMPTDSELLVNLDKYTASLRTNETAFPQELMPGKWTQLELVLVPSTIDTLGSVSVSISINGVALAND